MVDSFLIHTFIIVITRVKLEQMILISISIEDIGHHEKRTLA